MSRGTQRTVWARVKEALHDKGLPETQNYVAERILHIKQPSVSDWNKPSFYPKMNHAVALAKRLGICVEWLLTERGPKHPGPPGDELAEELWQIWEHIPAHRRRDILGAAHVAVAESTGVFAKGTITGEFQTIGRPLQKER